MTSTKSFCGQSANAPVPANHQRMIIERAADAGSTASGIPINPVSMAKIQVKYDGKKIAAAKAAPRLAGCLCRR